MRLESQLSRINCQTFSTGLSSGDFGGKAMMVMLGGTTRRVERCQPAWSSRSTACAPGATVCAISTRCRLIASVFRADGTKDVGGGGALIAARAGTRTALRPPTGDLVLLADTGLVREPDFYLVAVERLLAGDGIQAAGET